MCWIVEDQRAYATESASFLAEAARTGERPVVFPRGGPLDPAAVACELREQTARARALGYRGLRLIADMGGLRRGEDGTDAIIGYEVLLDRMADELGATIICAYPRWSFAAETLAGILAVHSVLHGHGSVPPFRFVSSGTGEWRLSGEVDLTVRSLFEAAFAAAVRLGDCAVDVSGLRFIDAGGLRVIVGAAGEETVRLWHAPRVLRRNWELCGFTRTAPRVRLVPA